MGQAANAPPLTHTNKPTQCRQSTVKYKGEIYVYHFTHHKRKAQSTVQKSKHTLMDAGLKNQEISAYFYSVATHFKRLGHAPIV